MARNFSISVETKEFNRHVKSFLKKGNVSTELAIKKFAFDLLKRIIRKNPVDTGRSRAAWYVSMEKLSKEGGFIEPITTSPNYSEEAVSEGKSKGQFIDHTKGYLNKWIEIINGVSYIIYLEYGRSNQAPYGRSNQAPYGMVRISMRELRRGKLPKELSDRLKKDWNSFY